jgi:hypothetical protein
MDNLKVGRNEKAQRRRLLKKSYTNCTTTYANSNNFMFVTSNNEKQTNHQSEVEDRLGVSVKTAGNNQSSNNRGLKGTGSRVFGR